jgi:TonB family protein
MPASRLLCTAIVLGVAIAITPLRVLAGDELEQQLRDEYSNKTRVLRGFHRGGALSYDSAGTLANGSADPGDWTVDGFVRVVSLRLSGQQLTLQAERLSVANDGHGFLMQHGSEKKKDKNANSLRIEVALDAGGITVAKADSALSKIFLTPQDRLAELVPDYWTPCLWAASTGKDAGLYDACSFSREFTAIPGVRFHLDKGSETQPAHAGEGKTSDAAIARIGKGVTPPKVISQKEPAFSEQARQAKYHGTVILSLTVDKTGEPRNIRIVRPLGLGLDQKAVEALAKWRFDPARKEGEPVDMEIHMEVDFHLY